MQIYDHSVKQRLHALVLEGGTTQYRGEGNCPHSLAQQAMQSRLVRFNPVEIGRQRDIIELNRRLDHQAAIFLGLFQHVGWNLLVMEIGAQRLVFPDDGLHPHQVDDALESRFRSDRQLDADRLASDADADVFDAHEEIGADFVHLVDEDNARHVIFVGLAPDCLGLRFHALIAVEHADRAIEHAQRAFDLNGEIDMAGRVDNIQALAVPERRRGGRRDRDAALLLLLHEIHGGGTVMHFANFVRLAGIIQDALGGRGLAGVDMRHDPEISVVFDCVDAGHCKVP